MITVIGIRDYYCVNIFSRPVSLLQKLMTGVYTDKKKVLQIELMYLCYLLIKKITFSYLLQTG